MATFIKTGFWEKMAKAPIGFLNLDRLIGEVVGSQYVAVTNTSTTITNAPSMNLSTTKESLVTSSATRTFTISYTGDDITLEVTLNATSSVFTFPATALCVSDGVASGDNLLALAGLSGDKYIIGIKKIGNNYYVVSKNFGQ